MKYLLVVIVLLSGCAKEVDIKHEVEKGALRHKLFVECMELSAKNGRNSDDDVHKIVNACTSYSRYLAISMMP
jgi:hypothetical protein